MTREEHLTFHKNACEKLIKTVETKTHDYSGFNDDPFANFKAIEKLNVITTEQGFLTRMMDKFNRLNSFVKQGVCNVKDEKIEDTLLDLANYSLLMAGYIHDKKEEQIKIDIDKANNNLISGVLVKGEQSLDIQSNSSNTYIK